MLFPQGRRLTPKPLARFHARHHKARKVACMYLLLNLVLTTLVFGVIPAVLIFGLAGRWDLWNVWVYVGIGVVLFTFQTLALYRKNPDLLKERMKSGPPGRVRWPVGYASPVLSILQWSIARLDQRFHWSDFVPPSGGGACW